MPHDEVRRILVVKLSSFGDIVQVTPCLRALKNSFPLAELWVAAEQRWSALLRQNPNLAGIVESPPADGLSVGYAWKIRKLLSRFAGHGCGFDLAIDFQGNRRSAAWVYLSGARAMMGRGDHRPGWRKARVPDLTRHAVEVCAEICCDAGAPVGQLDPELYTCPNDEPAVDEFLQSSGIFAPGFALLNPFSRWPSKSWAVDKAAALAARIYEERGLPVLVTGGPEEASQARELVRQVRGKGVIAAAGKLSLGESLCLFRRGRLMISCDSGPMHAAAALGGPVVALFGPTHPERTGPWGPGHIVVQGLRPDEHCAFRHAGSARFMEALQVDTVFAAVQEMLKIHP